MTSVSKNASELDVISATLYAEASGECEQGQEWIVWVLRNRAAKNRSYWGGSSLKNVCLHPWQFECWNSRESIKIDYLHDFEKCRAVVSRVLRQSFNNDPTNGCDHYNNPSKEGYPDWTNNVNRVRKIGNHQFYKSLD